MQTETFVHLHVHSEYSLLESTARVESLVSRAQELGMSALAITDTSVMYGVIPFYKACRKAGIQPIIGVQITVLPGEEWKPIDGHELILLAETLEGYRSIMRLLSIAHIAGYRSPAIPESRLVEFAGGIIVLSGGSRGLISKLLAAGDTAGATAVAQRYEAWFGAGNFYLEIQDHLLEEQKIVNYRLTELSRLTKIPLVATNDVRYVNTEDAAAFDVLLCIGQGKTVTDDSRERYLTREYYLKSPAEMSELFVFLTEALENTVRIAKRCQVEIPLGETILPKFQTPAGMSAVEYLRERCEEGVRERYGMQPSGQVQERLTYELDVINRMGFADYFLIVWDFIRFAREQGIAVGPGRGSAAGSLVAYVLRITDIDPVHYHLLFERFLNPERISMPDIDVDFSYDRRDEVIAYVAEKYGTDRVAQIVTFGTLAARAAVRDVGRALGLPNAMVDKVAKLIPNELGITLRGAIEKTNALRNMMDEHPQVAKLLSWAQALEGLPRHASTHAAGVVISREPLTQYVPLQEGNGGIALTQYAMESLEAVGLLKMDFLGLRNLTLLEQVAQMIEEQEGVALDLTAIPLDDARTYEMLATADTAGVFQLESSGMRHALRIVKPSEFEDIVAVLALFRPGPMEFIPDFAAAKHGERAVVYLHPVLKPILQHTYGYILYQEQIMQIASAVAGFTLGEADLLRRAVSKKKRELLAEQRTAFVVGAVRNGYEEKLANELYDLIVRFADYGFNRSHSAAYALISYRMAYVKANYPVVFLAALLTIAQGNMDKVAEYIEECRRHSISVLPPDVNRSGSGFRVENGGIRFGLTAIKNVGVQAIRHILAERENGEFISLVDVCSRLDVRVCNRRVLEALIRSGAFDCLPGHRASLAAGLETALEWSGRRRRLVETGEQMNLLGTDDEQDADLPPDLPDVLPWTRQELLEQEKELLGLHLSGHPLDEYRELCLHPSITPLHQLMDIPNKKSIRLAGIVASVRRITTKKGRPMAFVQLEDWRSRTEIVVFPGVYDQAISVLERGEVLLVEGKIEHQGNETKCIADHIAKLSDVAAQMPANSPEQQTIFIKITPEMEAEPARMLELRDQLREHPGDSCVLLYYAASKRTVRLADAYKISVTSEIIRNIEKIVGKGLVVVKTR
ncbi:DNA polymerase III subunit alpha [Aneurinibacillus uraniidurans]|uniref:DNA polymerase III subunit alpha n=1 Tax=Aneurinibacillus uraniidurans TaxID=2966586 RepID=UPI00234B44A0|nr:DNA polymerase III subunit alpha [Aneurinibacillus sp. B1]WCN37244.1 DNA polymerase III subunit alpha [Aneurinibacillus sp. B1]